MKRYTLGLLVAFVSNIAAMEQPTIPQLLAQYKGSLACQRSLEILKLVQTDEGDSALEALEKAGSALFLMSYKDPETKATLEGLEELTTLKELHLHHNWLKEVPESIQHLTNLQRLNLSQNELTNLPDWIYTSLPCLKIVDLSDNKLRPKMREIKQRFAHLNLELDLDKQEW